MVTIGDTYRYNWAIKYHEPASVGPSPHTSGVALPVVQDAGRKAPGLGFRV